MIAALRRLLIVIFIVLTGLILAWMYARNSGLEKPISPVRHPFFDNASIPAAAFQLELREAVSLRQKNPVFVVFQPKQKSEAMIQTLQAAHLSHPSLILWINTEMNDKRVFTIKESPEQTLKSVLLAIPSARFIINITHYRPGSDKELIKLLDEVGSDNRFLFQSDQDGILRDLRSLRATLLFGSSQAQITQLLLLLPFGLGSIAPLKADVYVTPFWRGNSRLVNQDVVDEIHRRSRKVLSGPLRSRDDAKLLLDLGVDGLIVEDHQLILSSP